jgi:hypothetical protein
MSQVAGMTIDRQPSEVAVGDRVFTRVDFSGVGLFRSTLFTENRCHLVSFHFTAKSPALLAALVSSVEKIGAAREGAAESPDPVCIRDQAVAENVLTKVDPAPSDPKFIPIPVRIVIGAEGDVRHVHVIRATAEQRNNIESALAQWRFKPPRDPRLHGRVTELETGLLIKFTSGGAVAYSSGDPPARRMQE